MANSVRPKFGTPTSALSLSKTAVEALTAGQVVEYRTGTDTVGVAGAGSLVAAGVVQDDIPVARSYIGGPKVGDGHEAVVHRNCVIQVTASGAITIGAKLICAAAGAVAVAGATPDARTVIGEALEAAANGATFNALIY